jgi:hypothetical protein
MFRRNIQCCSCAKLSAKMQHHSDYAALAFQSIVHGVSSNRVDSPQVLFNWELQNASLLFNVSFQGPLQYLRSICSLFSNSFLHRERQEVFAVGLRLALEMSCQKEVADGRVFDSR